MQLIFKLNLRSPRFHFFPRKYVAGSLPARLLLHSGCCLRSQASLHLKYNNFLILEEGESFANICTFWSQSDAPHMAKLSTWSKRAVVGNVKIAVSVCILTLKEQTHLQRVSCPYTTIAQPTRLLSTQTKFWGANTGAGRLSDKSGADVSGQLQNEDISNKAISRPIFIIPKLEISITLCWCGSLF